ncbi:MAG: uracil-DNA glycosylase [Spirochaetaceae bacterium]|nr:uracil-DNA glycosylase [Spirochaetaceae bacterium]
MNNKLSLYNFISLVNSYVTKGRLTQLPLSEADLSRPAVPQAVKAHTAVTPNLKIEADNLSQLNNIIQSCKACSLPLGHAIVGAGNTQPQLLVLSDSLSADDNELSQPFSGAMGQFVDLWLKAINLSRADCYFSTLVKCYSPKFSEEAAALCAGYLFKQIELLKPQAILACGVALARVISGKAESVANLRGRPFSHHHIPLVVTYSPVSVLNDESLKRPVWEDLKMLRNILNGGQRG